MIAGYSLQQLNQQKSIWPLVMFRIIFGFIMTLQFIKFRTVFLKSIINQTYFLKYDGFAWIELINRPYLDYLFFLLIGASICFTLGFLYRISAVIVCLGMAYLFLVEKSLYNNHYYLFILISFLMIFLDAHRKFTVDEKLGLAKSSQQVPFWQIFTIQLQLFLVYFFGGIAKLNTDWLIHAQPIQLWLPDMLGEHYNNFDSRQLSVIAYGIAYSGLFIDLVGAFILLHNRWRYYLMPVLVAFHLMNAQQFNIGYFPWFGIGSLVIFIAPEIWERFLRSRPIKRVNSNTWYYTPIRAMLVVFFVWQFLFPLRHWIMPGEVKWNMKGYDFAWFMKLNDTRPIFRMQVRLPNSTETYTFDDYEVLNDSRQILFLSIYPYDCVRYAHYIEHWLKQKHNINGDIRVYCQSYASLNNGQFQRKINPMIDLTRIPYTGLEKYFKEQQWVVVQGDTSYINRHELQQILDRR